MKSIETHLGTVRVGDRDSILRAMHRELLELNSESGRPLSVALSGGSTPKEWYRWMVGEGKEVPRAIHWTVSDERCVPLSDDDSNFGVAERLLLDPLGVPSEQRHPWPVELDPQEASAVYARKWGVHFGDERAYDLCFLGMGDDGHTASIFPGSPLLENEATTDTFAAVEVPGKGWRLTVTPTGLRRCARIVVTVTGDSKAERLKAVFNSKQGSYPIQILSSCKDRVVWLVDEAAASATVRF